MGKKSWIITTIVLALLAAVLTVIVGVRLMPEPGDPTVPVEHSTQRVIDAATAIPTAEPTEEPTAEPTVEPTAEPTAVPTAEPTAKSTAEPTTVPTAEPTAVPTVELTAEPTAEPVAPVNPLAEGEPTVPLPLEGVKIGIDPGHQGKGNNEQEPVAPGSTETKAKVSSGTQGVATRVAEYVVNLDVSLVLKDLLEELGAEVYMTRESHDVDISNIERAMMMNELGVDLVLRIHCNGSSNSSHNGISLFVKPEGPGAEESYAAAEALLPAMVEATGAKSLGIYVRDSYSGLNWSEVPSILVEMGFMSNEEEDRLLCDPDYQLKLIKGMVQGIADYMGRELPPEE